jgi:hypothetical protein
MSWKAPDPCTGGTAVQGLPIDTQSLPVYKHVPLKICEGANNFKASFSVDAKNPAHVNALPDGQVELRCRGIDKETPCKPWVYIYYLSLRTM